jgi:PTS system mannose-specific IID component
MNSQSKEKLTEKKLTKKDIVKSFFIWQFFSHANYNYERMQATAFAQCMGPLIRKLYTKKEDIVAALKRHLVFFNTEPNFGAVIHGITIAMEEERANGAPITDEAINSVKTGLMGPLAGIGDVLTQGALIPILLAIGIGFGSQGNVFGPIMFVVTLTACLLSITYFCWNKGYSLGKDAVEKVLSSGIIKDVIAAAGVLGCTVIGALAGKFITLSTPLAVTIGKTVVNIQTDLLDKIMPGLLPLGLTLAVLWLLNKGKSTIKIMIYLVIFGTILSLLKIF